MRAIYTILERTRPTHLYAFHSLSQIEELKYSSKKNEKDFVILQITNIPK